MDIPRMPAIVRKAAAAVVVRRQLTDSTNSTNITNSTNVIDLTQ
jgi:hypothetical protein